VLAAKGQTTTIPIVCSEKSLQLRRICALVRCPEFNRAYEYAIHLLRSGGITSDLSGEGNRRGRRRPMDWLVRLMFARLIRVGNLRVTTAGGSAFTFGDGTGTPAAIRFTTRAAQRRVILDPALKFGEAYMDGGLVVEEGSIADVLAIVLGQRRPGLRSWTRLPWLIRYLHRRIRRFNPRGRARRNVAHH
jgi:hypothetical protein